MIWEFDLIHFVSEFFQYCFYNKEFILDIPRVGSEMINWIATKHDWQLLYLEKSHVLHQIIFFTACAQNDFLQRECYRQTLTLFANSRLNNLYFTR